MENEKNFVNVGWGIEQNSRDFVNRNAEKAKIRDIVKEIYHLVNSLSQCRQDPKEYPARKNKNVATKPDEAHVTICEKVTMKISLAGYSTVKGLLGLDRGKAHDNRFGFPVTARIVAFDIIKTGENVVLMVGEVGSDIIVNLESEDFAPGAKIVVARNNRVAKGFNLRTLNDAVGVFGVRKRIGADIEDVEFHESIS